MKKHAQKIIFFLLLSLHGLCFSTGGFFIEHQESIKTIGLLGVGFGAGCVWQHQKAHKEGMQEVLNKLVKNPPTLPEPPSRIQQARNFISAYKIPLTAVGMAIAGITYYCRNTLPMGVLDQLTQIGTSFPHRRFTVIQRRYIGNNVYVGVIKPTGTWRLVAQTRTFIVKKLQDGLYACVIGIRGKDIGHDKPTTDAVTLHSLANNIFKLVEHTNDFVESENVNLQ